MTLKTVRNALKYKWILARPEGLEPPTPRFEAWIAIDRCI